MASFGVLAVLAFILAACNADGVEAQFQHDFSGNYGQQGSFQGPPPRAHAPPGYHSQHGYYDHLAHPGAYHGGGLFSGGVFSEFVNFGLATGSAVIFGSLVVVVIGLIFSGIISLVGGLTPALTTAQAVFGARGAFSNLFQTETLGDLVELANTVMTAITNGEKKDKPQ